MLNREMRHAGAALDGIVMTTLQRSPSAERPFLAWPLVCGSRVATRTRATSFANGLLKIEVPDTSWRNELQILAPRYVAAMNRYVMERVVRIEFVVRQN